ncbi:hypothetical protein Hamer_G022713 [Homarus americanus]|uniref:Uncharacterized protein n=1 Tax=Homarus americanus TaxID=6706 RepID=A0A8J5N381_HOMAM|nr:hypothetical protein Hamer_G022713 [Homarus americanus]
MRMEFSGCGRENSLCMFASSVTGEVMSVRCCGALQCLSTGSSHTCVEPKSLPMDNVDLDEMEI